MKILKVLAFALALSPTQTLANGLLTSSELKYLIKTCFATFYAPVGQPFQVDRNRLAKMGFGTIKDTPFGFEAQRVVRESIASMARNRFGPMIEVRRHKRNPNKLELKSCKLTAGERNNGQPFTNVSSRKVQGMLEAEGKRLGFRPYRNAKGDTIWIKGEIAVDLGLLYTLPRGASADGSHPPNYVRISGVNPRRLRGIKR